MKKNKEHIEIQENLPTFKTSSNLEERLYVAKIVLKTLNIPYKVKTKTRTHIISLMI